MADISKLLLKLREAGIKLSENVGDDLVFKLSEEAQKAHGLPRDITIPKKSIEGAFGSVKMKDTTQDPIGRVLLADKNSTTLPEMLQAKEQSDLMNWEKVFSNIDLNKVREKVANNTPLSLEEHAALVDSVKVEADNHTTTSKLNDKILRKKSAEEVTQEIPLQQLKNKTVAGITASPMASNVDISPLPFIKEGFDKYQAVKNSLTDKIAEQIDLTPDKSTKDDIQSILNVAADPINFIPGAPGMAAGALQLGLESKLADKLRRGR